MKRLIATVGLALCLVLALGTFAAANLEIVVPKVNRAPNIDGNLNDPAWLQASIKGGKLVVDLDNNGTIITDYPRIAYVCYDDQALYVAVTIFAPDVDKLMTTAGSVWSNDEIEIFLDPAKIGVSYQWGIDAGGVLDSTHAPGALKHAISKSGIRWVVETAIPWDVVGYTPKAGDKWGFNICGRQIATGTQWLCWNCTFGGFQRPQAFGNVIFGE
ncbi:MAG: hypothetical protein GX162_06385 [Firmicutes bacterium]|jgi:hypothetical protein|nr:hypothetical protein [Bacillota bacterium]